MSIQQYEVVFVYGERGGNSLNVRVRGRNRVAALNNAVRYGRQFHPERWPEVDESLREVLVQREEN